MGAIDDLKDTMNRESLLYPFDRLQTTAVLAIAARLDEAEKRITELELASPCPMLKSICEDWEYDAKPSPDKQEMVERYTELVYPTCLTGRKRIRQILSDLIDEVRGLRKEPQ